MTVAFIISMGILFSLAYMRSGTLDLAVISQLNEKVENFTAVIYLSLGFMIASITALSVYLSVLPNYLQDLEPLFRDGQDKTISSGYRRWYEYFKKDMNYLGINTIFGYAVLAVVLNIPHWFIWGSRVFNEMGPTYWLAAVLIFWIMIGVTLKFIWVLLTQQFHLFKFSKIRERIYLGYTPTSNGMREKLVNIARRWNLLPANTHAWKYVRDAETRDEAEENDDNVSPEISMDIFNVDDLGGLSPLTNITSLGSLLLGILFAIAVPLLILGLEVQLALVGIIGSFLFIIGGYLYAISSVRDAIKLQKIAKLEEVNTKLARITTKIIDMEDDVDNTEALSKWMEQYQIYDEIGRRIKSVPESPRSFSAVVKVITSGGLPVLSFGSIQQFDIISLFL